MTTLGELAKRISTWTSRGLVSAMILVAGLAFGRQVLQWWRTDDEPTSAAVSRPLKVGSLGEIGLDHTLQFGGSDWTVVRGFVSGDASEALRQLQARCAETIGAAALPKSTPGPAERDLLHRITGQKPLLEQPGQWRIDALDPGFPLVLGSREVPSGDNASGEQVGKSTRRVVTLGMAMPIGDKLWTTYTFHANSYNKGEEYTEKVDLIPTGSSKVMTIRATDGTSLVVFRGPDPNGEWVTFYDSWLQRHGWRISWGWVDRGGTRSVHGIRSQGGAWQRIDVLLVRDGIGHSAGVVFQTPAVDGKP